MALEHEEKIFLFKMMIDLIRNEWKKRTHVWKRKKIK
jgi:hypothetical protein